MTALVTRKLEKRFLGVHAVDHVDIACKDGSITALVGPNGSGKTTLINTITGILPMDGGEIRVGERTLTRVRPTDAAGLGIARTFQNTRLIGQMSVLDNILLALTERSVWRALFERQGQSHLDAAEAVLRRVGLSEKRHANAEELSYGQRKLLEIARALSMRSRIYFFDEPFAGLFPEMRKVVAEILRELRAGGAAVVLVEHDMDLIRDLADFCYVLDSGKVIAEGTPEQVLKEPHVIEAYLGK
ncbi:ABC transporter ATP-binding protein [Candidatus Kaiserbacteria bacterium]|nr:ABC transporter ATP-binding protein [Candidatus Kaiserbacteria bacterium]